MEKKYTKKPCLCGNGQVRENTDHTSEYAANMLRMESMLAGADVKFYDCTSCGKLRTLQETDFEDLQERDVCIDD